MQKNINRGSQDFRKLPETENVYLQEALVERDRFLERHQHLRPYQAEIDRVLDKSGDCHGRLNVLGTLIQGKLLEMQKELYTLTRILRESAGSR
jgi:hypothetical protein